MPVSGWGLLHGRPLGPVGFLVLVLVAWCAVFHRRVPLGRLALAGLVLKLGLGVPILVDHGFTAAYFANVTWTPPHERSLDYPGLGATRLDARLAFDDRGHRLPVFFLNDAIRFRFAVPPDRSRRDILPISVHWTGWRRSDDAERVRVYLTRAAGTPATPAPAGTAGTGLTATLEVDGRPAARLPLGALRAEEDVSLPAGWHRLDVALASPLGERTFAAGLTARGQDVPFDAATVYVAPAGAARIVADRAVRILSMLVDLGLLTGLALWVAGRTAGAAIAVGRWLTHRRTTPWPARPALSLVAWIVTAFVMLRARPLAGFALFLTGGDDWLAYETFARDILLNGPAMTLGRPFGAAGAYYFQPLYPYFVAFVHWLVGEDFWGLYVVQQLLFAMTVWAVYRLTATLFGAAAAWPAAAGAAWLVWTMELNRPGGRPMESFLSESLFLPLLALWVLAIVRSDGRSRGAAVGIGLLGGAAVLTRSTLLLALPFVVAAVAVAWWRAHGRSAVAPIALMVVALALPIAATTVRNVVVGGEYALVAGSGPTNLLLSNPPPPEVDVTRAARRPIARMFGRDPRVGAVVEYAIQAPTRFLAALARKAAHALGLTRLNSQSVLLVAIWVTSVPGVVAAARRPAAARPWTTLIPFAIAGTHLVAVVLYGVFTYGYRMVYPAYVLLLPYSGLAVGALLRRRA